MVVVVLVLVLVIVVMVVGNCGGIGDFETQERMKYWWVIVMYELF